MLVAPVDVGGVLAVGVGREVLRGRFIRGRDGLATFRAAHEGDCHSGRHDREGGQPDSIPASFGSPLRLWLRMPAP